MTKKGNEARSLKIDNFKLVQEFFRWRDDGDGFLFQFSFAGLFLLVAAVVLVVASGGSGVRDCHAAGLLHRALLQHGPVERVVVLVIQRSEENSKKTKRETLISDTFKLNPLRGHNNRHSPRAKNNKAQQLQKVNILNRLKTIPRAFVQSRENANFPSPFIIFNFLEPRFRFPSSTKKAETNDLASTGRARNEKFQNRFYKIGLSESVVGTVEWLGRFSDGRARADHEILQFWVQRRF